MFAGSVGILLREKYHLDAYDIKDYNEQQIINYRGKQLINEEIKSKIKIINNNQEEELIFKKNLKL